MSDQPAQQQNLTVDDIIAAGLNDLLDQDPAADDTSTFLTLAKAVSDAESVGDGARSRALRFMTDIMSMTLTPTEKAAPFRPYARNSLVPEYLTSAQVDLLAQLAGVVNNQLVRARLADLVWMKARNKGIAFPRMAIEVYCQ